MSIAALIRRMADAGAPVEAIALAVEAIEAGEAADKERRAKAAERKARQRAKERDSHGTVTGQSCDVPLSPLVPPSLSPEPLNPPPYNPPNPNLSVQRKRRTHAEIFEKFWSVYPRRDGANPKQPAALAFDRAVARGAEPDAIIEGAKRLAAYHLGKDAKFVPQAVTWLNQGRWQDESAKPDTEPINGATFIVRGSPQWDAWTKHRGREPIAIHHGGQDGQFMRTEWPPQENAA